MVGSELEEFLKDPNLPKFDILKIEKGFAISMAKLLATGESFCWSRENGIIEFSIIPEKIS
jgi:hypothetical protein